LKDKTITNAIQKELRKLADPLTAKKNTYFFKTNKGEYGHGDIFLGIKVPVLRIIAKENISLSILDTKQLVRSKYHEERLLGLLILVNKYKKAATDAEKEKIYQVYITHFKYINNWDLVDVTCPHIVGIHLMNKDRAILYTWAKSEDLWIKRIAMITNWWFVRKGDLSEVFKISKILLTDEHDLIHKAVGWMLREAGKKDMNSLESFLKIHYEKMPRTMLRYAIEKFPERKRQSYLKGKV
jgi:3-methyladenine DNA glycosylase AlkD